MVAFRSWLPVPLLLLRSFFLSVIMPGAESCTCFIVTPAASEIASTQVTYAADSHTLYGYLQVSQREVAHFEHFLD